MGQRYGQNFLRDPNLARVAIDRADLVADDVVLEVGPGRGVLTVPLAETVATVQAIEIDRDLEPALAPILVAHPNVRLTWGDAMKVPLADVLLISDAPCGMRLSMWTWKPAL